MAFEIKPFRTRVAKRIFFLFLICAFFPTTVMALAAFYNVREQLRDQERETLGLQCKSISVSIYERIALLGDELRLLTGSLSRNVDPDRGDSIGGVLKQWGGHFERLAVLSPSTGRSSFRDPESSPKGPPKYSMIMPLEKGGANQGLLLGDIDLQFVWGAAKARPPLTELILVDKSAGRLLFNTAPGSLLSQIPDLIGMCTGQSGNFEWRTGNQGFLVSYRKVNLKASYHYPGWIVILMEDMDQASAFAKGFKTTFIAVAVLSLAMVVLLSVSQIRKNTVPLDILQ
ncbi:MAG: hypothetical protein JRJ01_09340, partial [Deltaproteobacteria bacterium]|nr:hypothetical protein [Deltaproteobacteria bacterium]